MGFEILESHRVSSIGAVLGRCEDVRQKAVVDTTR